MSNDIRLAFRALRRQPAVALAAILTVGLAVAANTALFSIFDGLLFRPLAIAQADRIVHVELPIELRRTLPVEEVRRIVALMTETPQLEARAMARPSEMLQEGAAGVVAWGLRPVNVTPAWFDLLGVAPIQGGPFVDGTQEVIIGEDLWRTRYGADAALVGQPIDIPGMLFNRRPVLRGVMPRALSLPDGANVWFSSTAPVSSFNYARLANGATIEQVRAQLPGVVVTPLREHVQPSGALALGVLLVGTALLLLVAWVQVAALMAARAAGRAVDIGVRLALGASRWRLMRQYSAEGVVIAGAALGLAAVLAPSLTRGVIELLPEAMTRGQALMPDVRAFAFGAAVSFLGVLVLALAPMDTVRRQHPIDLIRGTLAHAAGLRTTRVRSGLLVGQLAITVVLIYMAGLAVRSVTRIGEVDLGFDPNGVVALRMPPVTVMGSNTEERRAHIARQVQNTADLIEAIRTLPGVTAVAGGGLPFYDGRQLGSAAFALSVAGLSDPLLVSLNQVTTDYARVLGLTILDGRHPTHDELVTGERQALVNATLARQLAAHGPVVGQQVTVNNARLRIAGVVMDFRTRRPDLPVTPEILTLARPPAAPQAFVLAKVTHGAEAENAVAAIRATFDRIWTNDPARELLFASDLADRAVADYRSRATMLMLIGVMCLPLALIGIVGALSYAIEQRRREIGIRLALGALPSDIRRVVFRAAAWAVGLGLVLGLCGGVVMGRAMSAYLFGVTAVDPVTVVGVAVILAALGWLAAWVPGRRAARIEPAIALRNSV